MTMQPWQRFICLVLLGSGSFFFAALLHETGLPGALVATVVGSTSNTFIVLVILRSSFGFFSVQRSRPQAAKHIRAIDRAITYHSPWPSLRGGRFHVYADLLKTFPEFDGVVGELMYAVGEKTFSEDRLSDLLMDVRTDLDALIWQYRLRKIYEVFRAFLATSGSVVVIFASTYAILSSLGYEFSGSVDVASGNLPSWILQWLYFSLVTFSTLGYGDIVPVSDMCRLLVASEVIISFFVIVAGLGLSLAQVQVGMTTSTDDLMAVLRDELGRQYGGSGSIDTAIEG